MHHLEIAKHFIEKESNVIMNSSNEENLKKTYEEFESPLKCFLFGRRYKQARNWTKISGAGLGKIRLS